MMLTSNSRRTAVVVLSSPVRKILSSSQQQIPAYYQRTLFSSARSYSNTYQRGKSSIAALETLNQESNINHSTTDIINTINYDTNRKNPVPDFSNVRVPYESKSSIELLRAVICFKLCRIPFLVENAEQILKTTRYVFGNRFVDNILKQTLYGHFCAGKDQKEIGPVLQKLENVGVGSILDYAAENDDGGGECNSNNDIQNNESPSAVAREYDYESETQCDKHLSTFIQCIQDAARLGDNGYAAIKITALGNPILLARLSTAIEEAKRLFEVFDLNGDGLISRDEFELGYNRFFVDGDIRIKEIFKEFDPNDTGSIDYISWSMMLSPKDLPKIVKGCRTAGKLADACPTDEEVELLNAMFERGRTLARVAADSGVRLLVDAEQKRYQPAIDNLVLELQRQFNNCTTGAPIIYNTYQCYLKDSYQRLRTDVERSERFNYHFGAKLVRGAYMESEREYASEKGEPDSIHKTIEDTHDCYNKSVEYLIRHAAIKSKYYNASNNNIEVMCATHNQESIEKAIESMNQYGIDRKSSTVCFAQLYGMSDQLTFNLGKYEYRAFKYVPYGEVHEVMPYLLRRAKENSAIVGGATVELETIIAELGRRFQISR